MKRPCKSRTARQTTTTLSTQDQIRRYIECSVDEHCLAWQAELVTSAPHWVYLLGLHLRLVELENLESAAQELL